MKLSLTLVAVASLLQEARSRLEKMDPLTSGSRWGKTSLLARRLEMVLGLLEQDGGVEEVRKAELHRLAAFCLCSHLKLPADAGKVGRACEELDKLGFEFVSLGAQGVFEQQIVGADFA